MFSGMNTDFSGIPAVGEDPNLIVSKVVQKAFIEVNEEGAEAVAATIATGLKTKCFYKPEPNPTIPFVVDRPFYYQIVDHVNNDLVLFSGHVNEPSL